MRTRRRDLDYLINKQCNQAHENIRQWKPLREKAKKQQRFHTVLLVSIKKLLTATQI